MERSSSFVRGHKAWSMTELRVTPRPSALDIEGLLLPRKAGSVMRYSHSSLGFSLLPLQYPKHDQRHIYIISFMCFGKLKMAMCSLQPHTGCRMQFPSLEFELCSSPRTLADSPSWAPSLQPAPAYHPCEWAILPVGPPASVEWPQTMLCGAEMSCPHWRLPKLQISWAKQMTVVLSHWNLAGYIVEQ